jgi:CxxC motif-containing protein (DUF1111 family)
VRRAASAACGAAVALVCGLLTVAAADGVERSGVEGSGVGWSSVERSGVERSGVEQVDAAFTGGATTVFANGQMAFSFPAANLGEEERTRFVIGNSFFRRNWVQAPASTRARDGLGPHFIARSCGGCHVQDGRGPPPQMHDGASIEEPVALLMRLSVPGAGPHGEPEPEPVYGDQFNNAAVQGVRPEGGVSIHTRPVPGRFADGTAYELQAPTYTLTGLGYGEMRPDVMIGPRLAPQVIGVGLLESIPESEILRNADEQAKAGGPIRGVPNVVWDGFGQRMMLGRFGWKANVATLAHQTGSAFRGDIGITSSRFPDEPCTPSQADCLAAPSGGGGVPAGGAKKQGAPAGSAKKEGAPRGTVPEIDDTTFEQVVFYVSTLAPPARRALDDPRVVRGEQVFREAQCATCHRPSYVTGRPALAGSFARFSSDALAGQTIRPYTDLLLHDMGEALADGRPDNRADGRQWRTPPLWGIGLLPDVNGHERLLHDGRARGVLEAVLWHGGEALESREHVRALSPADREALVKFVESL